VLIAYFAHDLTDPAIARRVAMLREGGASVLLLGFRRGESCPASVAGVTPVDLGPTADGRFVARALKVFETLLRAGRLPPALGQATVFMGRNLEGLAMATRARRLFAPGARLVYELLDIHRLLLGAGPASRALRGVEGWLLSSVDLVLTSSPAFGREYLDRLQPRHPPVRLVENKVFDSRALPAVTDPARRAGPWRVGWFGILRCRRSLEILAAAAQERPDLVEIVIRGRVAPAIRAEFDRLVAATPGLSYGGPYRYPDDLAEIYRSVDFAWAIDFYEAGQNSSWLLPNRLYESGLFGAVPVAVAGVETARWLEARQLGVVLAEPLAVSLRSFLETMTEARLAALSAPVRDCDPGIFRAGPEECRDLVRTLAGG